MAKRIKYGNGENWVISFNMAICFAREYQLPTIHALPDLFRELYDIELNIAIQTKIR